MNKISEKIKNYEKNLEPAKGNKMRFIFKTLTLVLVIIILPLIAITFGAIAVGDGITVDNSPTIICAGFIPWIILVITSGSFWFYFSKWTTVETSLVSKADFQKNKSEKKVSKSNDRTPRVLELEKNLGGVDNLTSIDACITRLRLTVKDRTLVSDEGLKKMGASGIVGKEKNIQVIFGWEADIFKSELKKIINDKKS